MLPKTTFMPRPELTEKMLEAIRAHSLTVIVAPLGYGKSALARSVLEAMGKNAWYYPVPSGPHDGAFLWHDMFSRFERQGMAIAEAMHNAHFPETPSQRRLVLERLRGLDEPVYLLLDDYNLVTDQAMHVFWENVAKNAVPHLHVVLFSRTRPEINLEELQIKELAAVFRQDALAFSEAETAAYFALNGINDPDAAAQAQEYSEGWPAAIRLCLQNWRSGGRLIPSPDVNSLLAHAVFAAYAEEERNLLIRLSVLEYFTEKEAAEISGSPRISADLRTLREKNAFLSYDAGTGRYRFHGIFRDFLRKELDRTPAIDAPALYRLAGERCIERGEPVPALRLLLRAGRDDDLKRILDIFLLYELTGKYAFFYEEIYAIVKEIPWRVRLQNPLGYLGFVSAYTAIWNDWRTDTLLAEAEEAFLAGAQLPEYLQKRIRGECEVIRAKLAFNDMDAAWAHYVAARRLLNGPSGIPGLDSLWNFGSLSMAFTALAESGGFLPLVETAERNMHLYRTLSGGTGKDGEKLARAEYWLELGKFAQAEPLLWEILRGCDEGRNKNKRIPALLVAGFCMARLRAATGEAEKASLILETMRSRVEHTDGMKYFACAELAAGYINAVLGRAESIPQWLRDGEILEPLHNLPPQLSGFSRTVHGRALLLQKDYYRLASVAAEIPVCAAPFQSLFARIHSAALKAAVAWHTHGQSAALHFLREALELSRPDGILLPLAEYGEHLIPLLRRIKRLEPKDPHLEAILALAVNIAESGNSVSDGKNLLTPRELEFMHYVIQGKSNPAIAETLGLSREAVKKTLGRAYAKLGASCRFEAVKKFAARYGDTTP